jgi:hypothetical protein
VTASPRQILERSRTIAVVGCSPDHTRPAHWVPAQLQRAGYRIIPVNPEADEILGEKCHARLAEIPEPVDLINVFRRPAACPDVVAQAVGIGAPAVWLQQGIRSAEARRIAEEAGIDYVEDDCTGARVVQWGLHPPD